MAVARAHIVTVGDELLTGEIVDTNLAWLGSRCRALGLTVVRALSIRDRVADIAAAVGEAREAGVALCLCSGGLGPTSDDRTALAVARACGVELARDPAALAVVTAAFERMAARAELAGRDASALRALAGSPENRKQAEIPAGARVLANSCGTAPGFLLTAGATRVACLPGVPSEMRAMMGDELEPLLAAQLELRPLASRVYRTLGRGESALAPALERELAAVRGEAREGAHHPGLAKLAVRYRAAAPEVLVTLEADAPLAALAALDARVAAALGPALYGVGEASLVERALATLRARGLTLALAEACSGGGLGALVDSVPGASRVFVGGVAAYADRVKVATLGVSPWVLAHHGAVSSAAAMAMAAGVRRVLAADIGLATTGVAGPGGGSPHKPVGTVELAVADARGHARRRVTIAGDREQVHRGASLWALRLLLARLAGDP